MRHRGPSLKPAKGFALIAALFMIVVLAGLGIFAVRLSSSQQQSTNLTLLMARAAAMANTGLEYGANLALRQSGCASATSWTLNQPALAGFTVNVSCTPSTHTIIPPSPPPVCPSNSCGVYELKSVATYSVFGQPDFVSRTAFRTVSNVP